MQIPITLLRRRVRPVHLPPMPGRITRRMPPSLPYSEFDQTMEQGFRIADSSLDQYELYVGEDQEPDFDASGQPVATSASLPFSYTPTPPASGSTKKLYVVVRKRNAYDLQSFNVFSTIVEIDSGGVEQLGPVTTPKDVSVYDSGDGAVQVMATYSKDDDTNSADTWEIYAKEGSDPVVGVDSPAFSGSMTFLFNDARLTTELTGYTAGNTLHVLVVAKRDSDDERAQASVVEHSLAESLDLSGEGQMFGGSYYEQR